MGRVYLNELAGLLAERHGVDRRTAYHFVSSIVGIIQKGLEKDRLVKIKGLGTFKIIDVDARESVNVNTGERLVIEGHPKLTFLPDVSMKDLVNKPFSVFETVVLNEGVSFDDIPADDGEDAAEASEPVSPEKTADVEEPEIPEIPEIPEVPEIPENPEILETPEEPEPLEILEVPESSVAEEEAVPFVTIPEEHDDVSPAAPEEPLEPAEPAEPLEPAVPTESVESAEKAEPEEPLKPAEPAMLASPVAQFEEEEEYDDEEWSSSRKSYLLWTVCSLLLLAAGFAAGYFVGRKMTSPIVVEVIGTDTTEPAAKSPGTETVKPAAEQTNTLAAAPAAEEAKEPEAKPQDAPQQAATETPSGVPVWEKYNDMDPRTRNGYYYIVGFDRIEKAREGDNSSRIAKRVFGAAEMACYIEVYNGIDGATVLEKDAEIKVPKIESKKSVRRRLQQQNK